ncbi:hypothetical protein PMAYCL1PPCAC_24831, partial [Pristionchus mayeri]
TQIVREIPEAIVSLKSHNLFDGLERIETVILKPYECVFLRQIEFGKNAPFIGIDDKFVNSIDNRL